MSRLDPSTTLLTTTSRAPCGQVCSSSSTMPYWKDFTLDQSSRYSGTTTNFSPNTSPTCNGCHCLQTQADGKCKRMAEPGTEGAPTDSDEVVISNIQGNNKKPLRKTAKVKPEEVSTPTHFEHLVHIEDLQSNANNFVVPKLSQDPVIKNIFNVIEKNIADAGGSSTGTASESYLEFTKKNQKSDHRNVASTTRFYVRGTEAYDNLNNLVIPSGVMQRQQQQQQQPVPKRSNLQLDLKCSTKEPGGEEHQSVPTVLAPGFQGKSTPSNTENIILLPKRKIFASVPSADSTDTPSPVTPFTPAMVQFQNSDLKKQEAAYDAFVSRNTRKPMLPLYENQGVIIDVSTTSAGTSEIKRIGFKGEEDTSAEIQQALKQLDDVLDEQIPIEVFSTLDPKSVHVAPKKLNPGTFERKNESTKADDSKKSVKQLAEMLNSKPLQFGMRNIPPKFHVTDQNSEVVADNNSSVGAKVSSSESKLETDPEAPPQRSKPSLIGVNIFEFGSEKSIAEIVTEKRNRKGSGLPRPVLPSPKPSLNKPVLLPKPGTSGEKENGWNSSSIEAIPLIDAPEKPKHTILDPRRNAPKLMQDEKSGVQKASNPEISPTIVKVPDVKANVGYSPMMTDAHPELPTTASQEGSSINFNQMSSTTGTANSNDHIYENLDQNGCSKLLETSFDGSVAKTVVHEYDNRNGTMKSTKKILAEEERKESSTLPSTSSSNAKSTLKGTSPLLHVQQQRKQLSNPEESLNKNTSTVPSAPPLSADDFVRDVKWRTDYVPPTNSDESMENNRGSDPVPPVRVRSKRGSYSRISSQHPRVAQRITSMYNSNSNELSSVAGISTDGTDIAAIKVLNRLSSISTPETAQIQNEKSCMPLVPPKPAPRRIDNLKRPTTTKTITTNKVADLSETESGSFEKATKRPVPIPRQSKLKATLNDDLLKKTSFTGTKTQHGTVGGLEPLITIAKTTNNKEENDDGGEWTLRL